MITTKKVPYLLILDFFLSNLLVTHDPDLHVLLQEHNKIISRHQIKYINEALEFIKNGHFVNSYIDYSKNKSFNRLKDSLNKEWLNKYYYR